MTRKTLVPVALVLATAGCGIAFTHAPRRGDERPSSANCTTSRTGPILDLVVAGLSSLVAVGAAAGEPDPNPQSNQLAFVVAGLATTGMFTVSGIVGLSKVRRCRSAGNR